MTDYDANKHEAGLSNVESVHDGIYLRENFEERVVDAVDQGSIYVYEENLLAISVSVRCHLLRT